MAYQAKRKKIYTADLELTEEDGTVMHTLHVELDPDSVVKKLSEKQIALMQALADMNAVNEDTSAEEKLGLIERAATDMFQAAFGQDGARLVVDFYRSRYIEMCQEIIPFINQEVIPAVRKMAQDSRKQVMQSYNRCQRRTLFGRK